MAGSRHHNGADPGSGNGIEWNLDHKQKVPKWNHRPRIFCYTTFGQGRDKAITTEDEAVAWVRENAKKGADGIKFWCSPTILQLHLEKTNVWTAVGLPPRTTWKLPGWMYWLLRKRVYKAWNIGTDSWGALWRSYHPELSRRLQFNNEQHRFEEAGKLWKQAAQPGSDRWKLVMDKLLALDFTLDQPSIFTKPTAISWGARNADWHKDYTLPSLWKFYAPSRVSHGSYWFNWGYGSRRKAWKENYQLWMKFVNEYKIGAGVLLPVQMQDLFINCMALLHPWIGIAEKLFSSTGGDQGGHAQGCRSTGCWPRTRQHWGQ